MLCFNHNDKDAEKITVYWESAFFALRQVGEVLNLVLMMCLQYFI